MIEITLDRELQQIVELACWRSLVRNDPGLARTIKELVRLEADPARIGRTALEAGESPQLAAMVENAATWIRDQQPDGRCLAEPQRRLRD